MNHAIDLVVSALLTLAGLVMALVSAIDSVLGAAMSAVGLPPLLQFLVLIGVAIWVLVVALRLLGRVFALLLLILFVLLLVHWIMPHPVPGVIQI